MTSKNPIIVAPDLHISQTSHNLEPRNPRELKISRSKINNEKTEHFLVKLGK
jgi:hypothetical protein